MAVFDTAHRNLYVAVTGDSRAVAGVWAPSDDGKGVWRVEALTEDQTGRNPSELARSVVVQMNEPLAILKRPGLECDQNIQRMRKTT